MRIAAITGNTGIGKSMLINRLMNEVKHRVTLIDCIDNPEPMVAVMIQDDTEILVVDHVCNGNDPQKIMLDSINHCKDQDLDVIFVDQVPEEFLWDAVGYTPDLELNFKGGFSDLKIELVENNKTTTYFGSQLSEIAEELGYVLKKET